MIGRRTLWDPSTVLVGLTAVEPFDVNTVTTPSVTLVIDLRAGSRASAPSGSEAASSESRPRPASGSELR
jgi:hypothetical protein